jgi:acyl-CoA reductase-like NAD-dependent aldehyde dehydrogenase
VDRAVAAARACHVSGALSSLRPVERGRMVRAMGDYLLAQIDEIAPVLTLESGKPLWEARIEVEGRRVISNITATRPRPSKEGRSRWAMVTSISPCTNPMASRHR